MLCDSHIKIWNFDMWIAKHLAQASCTELTLPTYFIYPCSNWMPTNMKNYSSLCWFFVTSSKESSSLKKRSHQTSPRILKRSRFNSISDLTTVILIQGMFTLCMIWIKSIQYSGIIFFISGRKENLTFKKLCT